jgi:hypothetical protein
LQQILTNDSPSGAFAARVLRFFIDCCNSCIVYSPASPSHSLLSECCVMGKGYRIMQQTARSLKQGIAAIPQSCSSPSFVQQTGFPGMQHFAAGHA